MHDIYREYKQGLISWDKAYALANNNAAASTTPSETEYWAKQMESLAVDAADSLMTMLGYKQNSDGVYYVFKKN